MSHHRRLGAVLILALVAFTAAACSSSSSGKGGLNSAGGPSSAGVTASPTPAVTVTATTTATPTAPVSHAYPGDYSGAILTAWAAHDTAYLTLLTDAATVTQLYGLGQPDMHWTAIPSDGAMGSTYNGYYNQLGSMIVIRLNNESLSEKKWHAGSVNSWDIMTYPSTAHDYLKKFLDAWISQNKQRMILLSSASITSHFLATTSPDSSYVLGTPSGAAGSTYILVTDAADGLNTSFQMSNSVLGHAHAIIGCTPTACS